MREILFRGKLKRNCIWVKGFLYITHNGEYEIGGYNERLNIERHTCVVDPNTVGQYTGLTANGKTIFEGDILSGYFSAGVCVNGLVEFKDGSFGISWKWGDGRQFAAFTSITNSVELEIIGNIHDNPELLEVSHE